MAANRSGLYVRKQSGGNFVVTDETATTGNKYWVDSSTGTDSASYGQGPDTPTATLDYAIGLATASKGDIIYIMPGHTENLATASAVTVDKIGLQIIGLGNGSNRPTFTYTAADATVVMSAKATSISNCIFAAGIDDTANLITMSSGDNHVDHCLFQGPGAYQFINAITLTTTKDDFSICDCMFEQKSDVAGTDGGAGTGAIYIVDSENIIIDNCIFYDQIETAAIHNKTTACKNLWVTNCRFYCTLATMFPFVLVDGATGSAEGCGGSVPAADDVTDAKLWGTLGVTYWIGKTSSLGNDSDGGGQGSANATVTT